MKLIKNLAQYYVNLLVKLGIFRFSMLLGLALVALAVFVEVVITIGLQGTVTNLDIIRSIIFGLTITPWAVYFVSVVVEQLEESRQALAKLVAQLKEMRHRDQELNSQLQSNIVTLNLEIEERQKAEEALKVAMSDLKNEVHQRKQTQRKLAEKTTLLRSFIDVAPDLFYYRDIQGAFVYCNHAMERLTGYSEQELLGLTPWDVYSEDIAQVVADSDQEALRTHKETTYEQWVEYPNGKKVYFEILKVPFYGADGQLVGLVSFGRDMTEHKKYKDALEKASRDKTTFISSVSHELKTPLNGIIGLSRMLLDTPLTEEQRQYMQTIKVSAVTLGNIFNDIIDMDKFDRRRFELVPKTINTEDFISEIGSISALIVQQKNLRFDLERLTHFPEFIEIDATRLRQVLWNLVSNATKFTKKGGVVMNVSAEVKNGIAEMVFEVEDSGIGIPEAELDKIFAMYYQVKSGTDNLHALGSGIGLAVSKQIIKMMKGDISVSSEEGYGTTFTVTIRVPVVDNVSTLKALPKQRGLKIFMVEDIQLNIVVAQSLLESLGHTVTVAMSGKEAFEKFSPEEFDIVLLDIRLPDMNGFDIAQRFRKQFDNLPPLVALTANVIKFKKDYIEKGMDDVLSKPLSVEAIQRVIGERCVGQVPEKNNIPEEIKQEKVSSIASVILDIDMLESYVDIVGIQSMQDNIAMFEKIMPEYIEILDSNMVAQDREGVTSEAHKIKGAAGSIGLMHIREIAHKAQSQSPAWEENITDWVDEIKNEYKNDIETLKSWLKNKQESQG